MSCGSTAALIVSIAVLVTNHSHRSNCTLRMVEGADELTSDLLTLMFIRNVVLSFGVNQQRGHEERLIQLSLQVDVVVAFREGAQPRKKLRNGATRLITVGQ